jgi:hypothetical protein
MLVSLLLVSLLLVSLLLVCLAPPRAIGQLMGHSGPAGCGGMAGLLMYEALLEASHAAPVLMRLVPLR